MVTTFLSRCNYLMGRRLHTRLTHPDMDFVTINGTNKRLVSRESRGCRRHRPRQSPLLSERFSTVLHGNSVTRLPEDHPGRGRAAINCFLADHDQSSKPFALTADPNTLNAAANLGYQTSDAIYNVRVFRSSSGPA
jgi:hypothetical protein